LLVAELGLLAEFDSTALRDYKAGPATLNGFSRPLLSERASAPQMNFLYPAIRSDYDSEDNVTFNNPHLGFMRVLRFNCSTSFNKNFAEASADMCNRDMGWAADYLHIL